ncbi:hypothetical protein BIW11_03242 [Tropilaelaps mercedesae]|uniref:Uncharacterized protein n=1 Tax=Tropilaelaps mercedesae TaxID=418985 RepID=A0A1V9XQB3_9ACAR|nr:hypothetical protein BIW11_03242 [Tropilaelaps mercedesae]
MPDYEAERSNLSESWKEELHPDQVDLIGFLDFHLS